VAVTRGARPPWIRSPGPGERGLQVITVPEEAVVSTDKKIDNKGQQIRGKVKEAVGKTVGNERLEAEGKKDQTAGSLKNAGENVKDAFRPSTP
jgi:uncharacterized protein YjbJ (UPF0337 family)